MNQRGEATLFCVLILVILSGLIALCGLRLQRSFSLLKKRTQLFLCVKETKGEINRHLVFMGRTNWALANTTKVQLISAFIPGLQGVASNADRLKRVIKLLQRAELARYFVMIGSLKKRGCPLDPRLALTAFELQGTDFKRGADERALLRKNQWDYHFISRPYALTLQYQSKSLESIHPKLSVQARESVETFSSLLSSL